MLPATPFLGIVTGVQLTTNGPILSVGNDSVPFSAVTAVMIPGSSPPSTGSSTTKSLDHRHRHERDGVKRDRHERVGQRDTLGCVHRLVGRHRLELARPTNHHPTY